MRSAIPQLATVSIVAAVFAPTTAFAHGDLSGLAIVIPSILVLHAASFAIAALFQRKLRSWSFIAVTVLAAAAASIMWFFGFLQFANNPSTARQPVWFWIYWIWLLTPFVLFVLSAASALYQRYFGRAA